MKFALLKNESLQFIPEDDADVFSLGKIATHRRLKKITQFTTRHRELNSLVINVKDIYMILCMLLKKNEHHFMERR